MPDLASLHPQIVHFVIALLIIGVLVRVISVIPGGATRAFLGPMAAILIFLGTAAAIVAVESGDEAHESVEQIPGVRPAVEEHQEWGERTRNLFILVSALEIGVLIFAVRKPGVARGLRIASAVVGIVGLWVIYETGEHGGNVVYRYAGGVGTWSGDTTDVRRLLVAGLYQNARTDRAQGNKADAARLTDQLAQLMPTDPTVRLLHIQSVLHDRNDPRRALAMLDSLHAPANNRGIQIRKGLLTAEALDSAGMRDSARAVLQTLSRKYPNVQSVTAALGRMK